MIYVIIKYERMVLLMKVGKIKFVLAVVLVAIIVLLAFFLAPKKEPPSIEDNPDKANSIEALEKELGITIDKSKDGKPLVYRAFDSDCYVPTQLQYTGESGVSYSFGEDKVYTEEGSEAGALILAPRISDPTMKVGFYYQASVGDIICELKEADMDSVSQNSFYVQQWNQEKIYRGQYEQESEFVGPCWYVDYYGGNLDYDESIFDNLTITVHTINLANNQILDSFKIIVDRDEENRFYFSNIVSSDISLDENNIRDFVLSTALNCFNDDGSYVSETLDNNGQSTVEMKSPYQPMEIAPRYIVERMDNAILTDFALTRTSNPYVQTQNEIDLAQFPLYAVSPCYNTDEITNRTVTIYMTRIDNRFVYLGYSDYINPNSIAPTQQ